MDLHTPNKRRQTPKRLDPALPHQQLHRIEEVRKREGVTLRTVAGRTNTDIRDLKVQENESTDIRLSVLYQWQRALDVPASELLAETHRDLSEPIRQRAGMIRLAKTAMSLLKRAENDSTRRLAQTVVDQCIEIMPELRHVSPWPERGNANSSREMGRIAEFPMPDFLSRDDPWSDD